MTGVIYMIINLVHLQQQKYPIYYIGSKQNQEKFSEYWGSSKHLSRDIKKYGVQSFQKVIIKKQKCSTPNELLILEAQIQQQLDVVKSKWFYNKSLAQGPFYNNGGDTVRSTTWINDGVVNKRISKNQVDSFLGIGFQLGRLNFNRNQGCIYINNGITTKSVTKEDLDVQLQNGWMVGKIKGNQENKRWVRNEVTRERKLIPTDQVHSYIHNGWVEGWAWRPIVGD